MLIITSWLEAHKLWNESRKRKLGNNTYLVECMPDSESGKPIYGIKLHQTVVVRYYPNGMLALDSGGWLTVTTKQRMNAFTPHSVHIHQKNREWFVCSPDYDGGFYDGLTVSPCTVRAKAWPDFTECQNRFPRLVRQMQKVAILSCSEAGCGIRDYLRARDGLYNRDMLRWGGGEAVSHYGGPEAVISDAIRLRHNASQILNLGRNGRA